MSIFALIALAFGISMDAFTASVVRGADIGNRPSFLYALKIGLVFGITEATTPILGYFLGKLAHHWVQAFDHWVSFVLLVGLGVQLIYETVSNKEMPDSTPAPTATKTFLTALATSIDAMVVGVSLAFAEANIWLSAILIGVATTLMAVIGVFLGARLGVTIGRPSQIFGGLVLIGIGSWILVSHLMTH